MDVSSYYRNGEAAYVSLNGVICWAMSLTGSQGTQQCGAQAPWNEDAVPVTDCSITLFGSGNVPLTVRVWTTIEIQDVTEEKSFGIANVVITNEGPGSRCPREAACRYCLFWVATAAADLLIAHEHYTEEHR